MLTPPVHKRNLYLLLATQLISSLVFLPRIVVAVFEEFGISGLSAILVTLLVSGITRTLVALPSGVFADRLGYARAIQLARLATAVAAAGLVWEQSLWALALLELLNGAATALLASSFDPLADASLNQDEQRVRRFIGSAFAVRQVAFLVVSVAGGYLATIDTLLPLWAGFLALTVALVLSLGLKELPSPHPRNVPKLGQAFTYLKADAFLRGISLFSTLNKTAIVCWFFAVQMTFSERGLSVVLLGWLFAVSAGLGILTLWFSDRIYVPAERSKPYFVTMLFLPIVCVVALATTATSFAAFALITLAYVVEPGTRASIVRVSPNALSGTLLAITTVLSGAAFTVTAASLWVLSGLLPGTPLWVLTALVHGVYLIVAYPTLRACLHHPQHPEQVAVPNTNTTV